MSDSEKTSAEKGAAELARLAKARGVASGYGTAAERRLRDTAIVAALQAGQKVKDVAQDFQITARQVQRIQHERSSAPSMLDEEAMQIVEGLARDYLAAAADFQAMAVACRESHPGAALRAMHGALDAREKVQALLEITGKLPSNLALLRSEAALERLAEEMMDVMERVDSGELPAGSALRELDRIRGVKLEPIELGPGDVRDDV